MEKFLRFTPAFISNKKYTKCIRVVYKVGELRLFLNEQGDIHQLMFKENPIIENKLRKILEKTSDSPLLIYVKYKNVCKFVDLITKNRKAFIVGYAYPDGDETWENYEVRFKNTLHPEIK